MSLITTEELLASYEHHRQSEEGRSDAIAALLTLRDAIRSYEGKTVSEFTQWIQDLSDTLSESSESTVASVSSACKSFCRTITNSHILVGDWKKAVEKEADTFTEKALSARRILTGIAVKFIKDDVSVLTMGMSKVVLDVLKQARDRSSRLNVYVTESQPSKLGHKMAKKLVDEGIHTTLVSDAAVGHIIDDIDVVVCGAEAVVENGGIINTVGTHQIAMLAHFHQKPVYVVAESFKFSRLFILNQREVPSPKNQGPLETEFEDVRTINPAFDYTPPSFITLLFTDKGNTLQCNYYVSKTKKLVALPSLGKMTPSAVSDVLINL
eukprot:m.33688 g.33688  ORF g.33688 m.33688 type:complete len:324 (+) comp6466_c0_seq1:46-1017(+)